VVSAKETSPVRRHHVFTKICGKNTDFERGNVIGQVFYNKYVSEILSLLDIPATVNFK